MGNFALDASVDTAADGFINNLIDGVASHLPGGEMLEARRWLDLAIKEDASIFSRDIRSFITMVAVYLAPLSRPTIRWLLK